MNEKRPEIKWDVFSEHVGDGAKKRKPRLQSNGKRLKTDIRVLHLC